MSTGGDRSSHLGPAPAAEPQPAQDAPPAAAEPSFAERARTLIHTSRQGTLSTQSRRAAGFPFGSVAPYGTSADGSPTFLISSMAMHTQNLAADAHASLLVAEKGHGDDPLALGRVTLLGVVTRVPDGEVSSIREDYLARHESAQSWVDFSDFAFYRMGVVDLYFVAGFGAMGWIDASSYASAAPDPLCAASAGILAHMNADHADALRLYCRCFADLAVDDAEMISVDRLGFRVRARTGDRVQSKRIAFPREVRDAQEVRVVLVEMVREARARLA